MKTHIFDQVIYSADIFLLHRLLNISDLLLFCFLLDSSFVLHFYETDYFHASIRVHVNPITFTPYRLNQPIINFVN